MRLCSKMRVVTHVRKPCETNACPRLKTLLGTRESGIGKATVPGQLPYFHDFQSNIFMKFDVNFQIFRVFNQTPKKTTSKQVIVVQERAEATMIEISVMMLLGLILITVAVTVALCNMYNRRGRDQGFGYGRYEDVSYRGDQRAYEPYAHRSRKPDQWYEDNDLSREAWGKDFSEPVYKPAAVLTSADQMRRISFLEEMSQNNPLKQGGVDTWFVWTWDLDKAPKKEGGKRGGWVIRPLPISALEGTPAQGMRFHLFHWSQTRSSYVHSESSNWFPNLNGSSEFRRHLVKMRDASLELRGYRREAPEEVDLADSDDDMEDADNEDDEGEEQTPGSDEPEEGEHDDDDDEQERDELALKATPVVAPPIVKREMYDSQTSHAYYKPTRDFRDYEATAKKRVGPKKRPRIVSGVAAPAAPKNRLVSGGGEPM